MKMKAINIKGLLKENRMNKMKESNSQFITGGYIHTISDEWDSNTTGLKRFSTFNSTRSEILFKDKDEFNTKIIENLIEIVSNLMKNIQEQKDEIKGQKLYIEEVDKALVVVEKKQNILIDDLQFQQSVINQSTQDFGNHK